MRMILQNVASQSGGFCCCQQLSAQQPLHEVPDLRSGHDPGPMPGDASPAADILADEVLLKFIPQTSCVCVCVDMYMDMHMYLYI